MKQNLLYLATFALGTVTGSLATWFVLNKRIENKYAQIAQTEIDSVKETFANLSKSNDENVTKTEIHEEKPVQEKVAYNSLTNRYSTNSDKTESEENMVKPYVIAPEEFGELDEYEMISLSYYSDGVLADTITNEQVEDIDDLVGDFESHFGEYEDDSVFIRNDKTLCDYEILKDVRTYDEVVALSNASRNDE